MEQTLYAVLCAVLCAVLLLGLFSMPFLKPRKRIGLITLVLIIVLISLFLSACQEEQDVIIVNRVVDGDTIEVKMAETKEKVRLIGIDTPETVHPEKDEEPYGKEASDFSKERLKGQEIRLELDVEERDRYGRILAYVWLGDEMFNETLLLEGYARLATFPPNVKYVERFTAAQKEARESKRGLWALELEEDEISSEGNQEMEQGKYLGSRNSDKYHLPTCKWAKTIKEKNQVWFESPEEAEAAGYKPCKNCCGLCKEVSRVEK